MEKFDYTKAISRLEEILSKVEDPSTGVDDIDKYVKEAESLGEKCRKYLRTLREKADAVGSEK